MLPEELSRILARTPELGESYLVGGCVRDWLLGRAPKDFDVEVFGIDYDVLEGALRRWGRTDLVGRSFGVVKLTVRSGVTYDFSLARRDSKTGPGHKGFEVEIDPKITLSEAAARRDFTVNAFYYDPRAQRVVDCFGGEQDLKNRVLRHTSAAFAEDPLRVLRGMQFAGRFNLSGAPETLELCRQIRGSCRELAVERVREEWVKWAARSVAPSAGLRFLLASGWGENFPEVAAMAGVAQDAEWHPEGDVFEHTCHACDAMARLPEWQQAAEEDRTVLMLAVLAHDFGKPGCTHESVKAGRTRLVSPDHDQAGIPLTERFLERIDLPPALRERIVPLVAGHMAHLEDPSDRMVRRLARRLAPATIDELCAVITADSLGRPPRPPEVPPRAMALQARASELRLRDRAPRPILMGRHLIELGQRPGPEFGALLAAAFEAQLEGEFADLPGALEWLKHRGGA